MDLDPPAGAVVVAERPSALDVDAVAFRSCEERPEGVVELPRGRRLESRPVGSAIGSGITWFTHGCLVRDCRHRLV